MPKVAPSETKERTPIPVGDHVLTLMEVKPIEQENRFEPPIGTKPDGTPEYKVKKQFVWVFQSNRDDDAGDPYEYVVFTGRYYGDDRAKLTAFLQMLLPDADDAMRASLDTDMLIGRQWKTKIQLVKTQKGNEVPRHLYLIPVEAQRFDPDEVLR